MAQNRVWQPADGQRLKALRQAAGLDVVHLARLATVSTTQIAQLEDGGDSAFYSPAIKMATGRRVLGRLGVPEAATPAPAESSADVPGAGVERVAARSSPAATERTVLRPARSLFGPLMRGSGTHR